jgi:hypothetical protein
MAKLSMSSMGKINILYKFQYFNFLLYKFEFLFTGVSECIMMGIPTGIGTGLFKLLHKYLFLYQLIYFPHPQVYIIRLSKLPVYTVLILLK